MRGMPGILAVAGLPARDVYALAGPWRWESQVSSLAGPALARGTTHVQTCAAHKLEPRVHRRHWQGLHR